MPNMTTPVTQKVIKSLHLSRIIASASTYPTRSGVLEYSPCDVVKSAGGSPQLIRNDHKIVKVALTCCEGKTSKILTIKNLAL
ncbi:predicted protein [Botrytis cinerea T4]|uniref:Uncharacterized protein n=1 Tax=Botryotinia fuckeliana (strain T4) TaxID=999810 RepID=G2XSD0_BOTF4|nr:predicted protein [Botrytis cinerea T4]